MLTYGGSISLSSLFIVTWHQVGYAPSGFDKVCQPTLINGDSPTAYY